MKSQKGITLMLLVTTVIMMGLIFGAITYNSVNSYKLNSYYTMCADIELLDEKIALYYLEHKKLPITNEYIEINRTEENKGLIENYNESNVNYNPNNSDSGRLYVIDLSQLDNLSLQRTEYYIDEQSHTIYAGKGRKIGEETYYTVPTKYQEVNLTNYQ